MKNIFRLFFVCCVFLLVSCGYQLQGMGGSTARSIFGNGSSSVAITKIEDPSLYTWITYYLTNKFHSEMNFRKLAVWDEKDKADYTIEIILHKFDSSASLTNESDRTLINTINIDMEVRVKNTHTNEEWNSGILSASENFSQFSEEQAVKEVLQELVYMTFNAMQNNF